jgi:phage protein D
METVAKNVVEISIAGKNVTADVSRYLSRITYTDKLECESDDISLVFEDTSGKWQNAWYPAQGDSLQVKLGRPGQFLDCGIFEIDEVELECSPDALTVKAVSVSIKKSLRTKKSKAFEEQTLWDIAQYFADEHELKIVGPQGELEQIEIGRKTQEKQTDLSFLSALAKEYGYAFSLHNDCLYFTSKEQLEARKAILSIPRTAMSTARFRDKTSEVYIGVAVDKRNARKNDTAKWSIMSGKEGEGDILVLEEDVENEQQAAAIGKAKLKEKQRDKYRGSLTMPGNIKLVAGVNIELTGIGKFSGKWHVISSSHTVDPSGGYTTSVDIRKILGLTLNMSGNLYTAV